MLFCKGLKGADSSRNKRFRRYNLIEAGTPSVYSQIARYIYRRDIVSANIIP